MNPDTPILVTGAAGFIGFHLTRRLLKDGFRVVGLDNLNTYYDVKLKEARLEELKPFDNFSFFKTDLADASRLEEIFKTNNFDVAVNLAAQAGVRYSLENPGAYVNSNVAGFVNLLECCRHFNIQHLVFASSSSVYGANTKMPFSVHHNVDHPVSLYAATKKSNELMAHTYSHLFDLPCTGLRFFTVYGPWGRPDMALYLFTDAIFKGKPIKIFNKGNMERDFTYIDDIVEGVVRVMNKNPVPNPDWSGESPDPGSSYAKYKIYNIGNNQPVKLMDFIETLERVIGKKAKKEFLEMQAGDVKATYANIDDLIRDVGVTPATPLQTGIERFVEWFKSWEANPKGSPKNNFTF